MRFDEGEPSKTYAAPPAKHLCLTPVACDRLMQVMDNINERWGRGTMRTASVPAAPDWGMRREMMSQSYTTRIDQLWTVKC